MKRSHLLLLSLISSILIFSGCVLAETTRVLFVLDASGSMKQKIDGRTQLDLARESLITALGEIPAGSPAAVRVYSHRIAQTDKAKSCLDTELLIPFGAANPSTARSALDSINAIGYTPIAYSLEQAAKDFPQGEETKRVIILLSDGEETCGGDPTGVIKKLYDAGIEVTVHTIGFNVDQKTRAQLAAIASAGRGQYFDARDGITLTKALVEATKKATFIQKAESSAIGKPIRGGDSFETATAIEANTDYRLDHHQKREEYDYFKFDAKGGQEISVELRTHQKGIGMQGDKAVENDSPYAGLRVVGADRKELKSMNIIGQKLGKEIALVPVAADGTYYLLLGSSYEAMNMEHVSFKFNLSTKGDLGGDSDAPAKSASALEIEAKRYPVNFLGGSDKKDIFKFKALAGETYFVGVVPGDNFSGYLNLKVSDDFKQKITEKSAPSGEGIKSETFTIPSDGEYLLEIGLTYDDVPTASEYAFELKKVSAAAAVQTVAPPSAASSIADGSTTAAGADATKTVGE